MSDLGLIYGSGQGVAQDYAKAREWFEKAAAKDDARAMRLLGVLYDNGYGVTLDYAKAREWYEKAAANGDAACDALFGRALRLRPRGRERRRQGARMVREGRC